MRDADVRLALHAWLTEQHRDQLAETRFVDELSIAGQVRVDTAVLNGSFAGFEIKSASDTLRRLPRQVEIYSSVLDYATLVVAKNHSAKARTLLPRWWGIIEASDSTSGVALKVVRASRRNPRVDLLLLCSLLWKDEAIEHLEKRGGAAGFRSKSNRVIWSRLVETVDPDELRDAVRESLKARSGWRVAQPSLQRA